MYNLKLKWYFPWSSDSWTVGRREQITNKQKKNKTTIKGNHLGGGKTTGQFNIILYLTIFWHFMDQTTKIHWANDGQIIIIIILKTPLNTGLQQYADTLISKAKSLNLNICHFDENTHFLLKITADYLRSSYYPLRLCVRGFSCNIFCSLVQVTLGGMTLRHMSSWLYTEEIALATHIVYT